MAIMTKPPTEGHEREAAARRAVAAPPPPVSAPRAQESTVRIGPLFGVLGVVSLVLMALMVTTNYLMLRDGRAGSTGQDRIVSSRQGAGPPAGPSAGGPAAFAVTASEFKFAPAEFHMAGPGDLTV